MSALLPDIKKELINDFVQGKSSEKSVFGLIKYVSREYGRKIGLRYIKSIIPDLIRFSGADIAPELYRTITDVTRWWP